MIRSHIQASDAATRAQVRALLALWALYEHNDDSRDERLAWASRNVGRKISTFNDLKSSEARSLMSILQLGEEMTR